MGTAAQDAAVAQAISSVPASVFDAVGAGTAGGLSATTGQPLLTADGKPEVLHLGGGYCPFCAAQRWVLTALFARYGSQSIPFVDLGNQYLLPQVQYLPSAIDGMTWAQVAAALRSPSSAVARDIDGGANIVTAAVCRLTNGQPGGVCSSAGVTAAAGSLSGAAG